MRSAGRAVAGTLAVYAAILTAACASRKPPPPATHPAPSSARPISPAAASGGWSEEGLASWYGGDDGFEGKPTASGELYDSSQLTAAHRELPLGSVVDVTSLDNGRVVRVRINDRGPFTKGRIIDLSQAAARTIAMIGPGTARVRVVLVVPGVEPTPVPAGTLWAVQVGSFGERPRADRHADRVRAAGFTVYFEPYQGLTRVKVGPMPTRDDATETLARLEQAGFEGIVVPANK
ncbi:MAG TPA: septal ring lytic transglycosylase RlpA family protein [Thermoanaerobaculia bacterium]|nr:septal ring lytic transglycosylase RlpA family protein [Thermoanaerobaculia bacterium]